MSRQTKRWRWTTRTVLLVVLAISLAGCFDLSEQEAETSSPDSSLPTSSAEIDPDFPFDSPFPTPTAEPGVIVIAPGEDRREPTWTPFPTWPPPPTPTRRPGPTATPLPLVQPAKDATGDILYVARNEDEMHATVFALPVDGAGVPKDAPAGLNSDAQLGWGLAYPAPDGRRLAIVGEWGAHAIFYVDSGKVEPLFRENVAPGGVFFDWHPDSRQVLIRADENYVDTGLWLVDTDSGERTVLVISPYGYLRGGTVSPDGQKVAYVSQRDFTLLSEMWIINADGSDPRLIYTSAVDLFALAWSPDGSKIAFIGDGVMVIDADGSNPRSLSYNFASGYLFRPAWSPDSRTLAVIGVNGFGPDKEKGAPVEDWFADAFIGKTIYLVDVVTGKERPLLSDDSSGNIDPAWSPDGSQIAFASIRSGVSEIWVVSADGSNLHQLTHDGRLIRFPYWRRP